MYGTIKNFKADKFFGFITGEDDQEYFFHGSELQSEQEEICLCSGDPVEFIPTMSSRGLRAENVRIVTQNETN